LRTRNPSGFVGIEPSDLSDGEEKQFLPQADR
jgi:hypothetical protein